MKAERHGDSLDDLIHAAIGRHDPSFDFRRWKQRHQDRVDVYRSQAGQAGPQAVAPARRTFTMTRAVRIAAAAVIVVAVLALASDWLRIATPAFGLEEIRKAMQQVEHSHFVLTVEFVDANAAAAMGRRPEGWESWSSRNPPRQITRHADGRIFCTEEDTGRVFRYDPESNTIVVEQGEATSPELLQMSVMDRFARELEDAEKRGTKVEFGETAYEGRSVTTVRMDYNPPGRMRSILSMVIDPDTHLMRKMTWEQIHPKGWRAVASGVADYPASGPTDIYEAGAPRDAKVLVAEQTGRGEPDARTQEVLKRYAASRGRLPQRWALVVVQAGEDDVAQAVAVLWMDGRKGRWEHHYLQARTPAREIPVSQGAAAVREWANAQESWRLSASLYDGRYRYDAQYDRGSWHREARIEQDGPYLGGSLSEGLSLLGWAGVSGRLVDNAYASQRGLLCIEARNDANIQQGKVMEPARRILHYLDPARDCLCVRREVYQYEMPPGQIQPKVSEVDFNPHETPAEFASVRQVEEYGQFETGQPYAAKAREVSAAWDDRHATWEPEGQRRWIRLYLQTNPEFPEGVFDPNHPGWVP